MIRINIMETDLKFTSLSNRAFTDKIIIHHTGSARDNDLSAKEIHRMHLQQGWVGIGYHYVIRKNGVVERGRPVKSWGAHCYGYNYNSIGIHICGNFDIVKPTDAQIESASMLIANLCYDFKLPMNKFYIGGHCDFDATACPGKNLYSQIPTIIGKANWYAYN